MHVEYTMYTIYNVYIVLTTKLTSYTITYGIYLDSQMTYKKHINYLSNKLSKIIYTIKKISFLDTKNLILLYNSFYLSNLSYWIEVWSNTYKSNITK